MAAAIIAAALAAVPTASARWVPVPGRTSQHPCAAVPSGYACYTRREISFVYPKTWQAMPEQFAATKRTLVYLSTDPLHDPCQRTPSLITCHFPIDSIGPNGVFAYWLEGRWSVLAVRRAPGTPTRIGGRPARVAISSSGSAVDGCRQLGGDEAVTALVARPVPHTFDVFVACLSGPDHQQAEKEIGVILESTRFPHR
jgi:hypothetical protein